MKRIYWSLVAVSVLLVSYGMGAAQSSGMQHGAMKHGNVEDDQTAMEVCRGFLVLENGYAVLSGMSDTDLGRGAEFALASGGGPH